MTTDNGISEFRLTLHAAGFAPTAVRGKEALMTGWRQPHSAEEIARWLGDRPDLPSTGINTERTPAFDLDILHPEAVEAAEELIRSLYDDRGLLLTRIGLPPKRTLLFRTSVPFPKIRVDYVAPGESESSHHVEVLADGQQVVVDGIHPVTKKPYTWRGGYRPGGISWQDLPEISEEEARSLVSLITEMLQEQFGFTIAKQKSNGHPADTSEFIAREEAVDVDAMLAGIRFGNIHDTWKACMGSLLRQGLPAADVVERLLAACEASPACHPDPDRKKWRSALASLLTWYASTEREFVLNLSPPLQTKWHDDLRAGKRPALAWRWDLGLHVRGWGSKPDETAQGTHSGRAEASAPDPREPGPTEQPDTPPPKKYRFPLIAFGDLRPGVGQSYLIDELFPTAGLALVYGAPKSGKSFWTFDAMMHITLAWEYRDRAVQSGPAVYCAFEGAHGYHKRGEAFRRHHCLTDERPPIFVVPGRADLVKDHAALIADIRAQLADAGVVHPPKAVVLDTLNKSLIGSESKDVDMANYIAAAEAIQKAFDCLVVIVHHHGIEESRPRGHTSLRGAIDVMIKVTRDVQNNIIAVVEEMRDGPEGAQIASRLVVVNVGEDLNGKPLTSAAVEAADMPAGAQNTPRLTPNQKTMLTLLEEAGVGGACRR